MALCTRTGKHFSECFGCVQCAEARVIAGREERNVWGTPISLINADEFCPQCEREVPVHYEHCPTRQR